MVGGGGSLFGGLGEGLVLWVGGVYSSAVVVYQAWTS